MKKVLAVWCAALFIAASCGAAENLSHLTDDDTPGPIKVYLKEVTDESGKPGVDVRAYREVFAQCMKDRQEVAFESVTSEKDAEVAVNARIREYAFNPQAMPSVFGVAAVTADTLRPKGSVTVSVDYEVIDPATGKVLLISKQLRTEERRPRAQMTEENAFLYGASKNIHRFLHKMFYKDANRSRM